MGGGGKNKTFDALVVSGGGVKGAAAAGAVREFQRAGMLGDLKMVVGTSVGAVVAAAVAAELDLGTVFRVAAARRLDVSFDLAQLGSSYGIDNGASLDAWLAALGFGGATFRDMKVPLVVCVTDVDARRPAYLSVDTAPDMPVVDALRMSCSIPLLFAAKRHEGRLLIDGCLTDNFPTHWALAHGAKRPLGITMTTRDPGTVTSLQSYIMAVLECATCGAPPPAAVTHLDLDVESHATQFDLPRKELRRLFRTGAAQAAERIKKLV